MYSQKKCVSEIENPLARSKSKKANFFVQKCLCSVSFVNLVQQRPFELAVNWKTKRILTAIIGTLKITLRIHKRVFLFLGTTLKSYVVRNIQKFEKKITLADDYLRLSYCRKWWRHFFRISTRNYHRQRCVQIHALDNTDGNTIRARGSLFLAWTRAHSRDLFSLPSQFTFGSEKVIGHEVWLYSTKLIEITFNVRRRYHEFGHFIPDSFYRFFFESFF